MLTSVQWAWERFLFSFGLFLDTCFLQRTCILFVMRETIKAVYWQKEASRWLLRTCFEVTVTLFVVNSSVTAVGYVGSPVVLSLRARKDTPMNLFVVLLNGWKNTNEIRFNLVLSLFLFLSFFLFSGERGMMGKDFFLCQAVVFFMSFDIQCLFLIPFHLKEVDFCLVFSSGERTVAEVERAVFPARRISLCPGLFLLLSWALSAVSRSWNAVCKQWGGKINRWFGDWAKS